MPTLCRCHVASAIDTLRAHRLAPTDKHADPRRHRRLGPSTASNQRLNRREKPLGYRSGTPQKTPLPPAAAQPNPQIPISLRPHTAGSFFGDFRTPSASETLHETGTAACGQLKPSAERPLSQPAERKQTGGSPTLSGPSSPTSRPVKSKVCSRFMPRSVLSRLLYGVPPR
jgi:hypothetical protein